jgi:hypothetical protein
VSQESDNDQNIEDELRVIRNEFEEKFLGYIVSRILEKVNERLLSE